MSLVFVSHSSKDENAALAIVNAFERLGLKCWIAPRDILPGSMYAGCIVQAIQDSIAVVLILTTNSHLSPHVLREIQLAQEEERQVFPIYLDGVIPNNNMRYLLCVYQRISATLATIDTAAREVVVALENIRNTHGLVHRPQVDQLSFLKDIKVSSLPQKLDPDTIRDVAINVPVLKNLIAGVENAKLTGDVNSSKTLEGFADLISAIYLLCREKSLTGAVSIIEAVEYNALRSSWAIYEKGDIETFFKEIDLARGILAEAEYAMAQGDEPGRSFQEGRARALFMIYHIVTSKTSAD